MADMFGIIVAGRLVSVSARNLDTIILRIDRWGMMGLDIKSLFKNIFHVHVICLWTQRLMALMLFSKPCLTLSIMVASLSH